MARSRSRSVMSFLDFKDLVASFRARSIKTLAAPEGIPRALAWILRDFLILAGSKGWSVVIIKLLK